MRCEGDTNNERAKLIWNSQFEDDDDDDATDKTVISRP